MNIPFMQNLENIIHGLDSINDRAELLKKSSIYDVDSITNADEFAVRKMGY